MISCLPKRKKGHLITRDWIPHTEKRTQGGMRAISDIKEIYHDNVRAIREADLVAIR